MPLRHTLVDLHRLQTRSPTHSLTKGLWHGGVDRGLGTVLVNEKLGGAVDVEIGDQSLVTLSGFLPSAFMQYSNTALSQSSASVNAFLPLAMRWPACQTDERYSVVPSGPVQCSMNTSIIASTSATPPPAPLPHYRTSARPSPG